MNEKEIYDAIMASCSEYMGLPDMAVPAYFNFPYPQRLGGLAYLNKWHVLRSSGDIDKFLKLNDAITALPQRQPSGEDVAHENIIRWLQKAMKECKPKDVQTPRKKFVLSFTVWGEEYTGKLFKYVFASLLAPGNIAALCADRYTIIHIQTNNEGAKFISEHPTTKKLCKAGANIVYEIIPDEVLKSIRTSDMLYWFVGATASMGLTFAKRNGAAFHWGMPDIVYSENYFKELMRLAESHRNIVAIAPRSDEAAITPMIEPYFKKDYLAIPSGDLVAIALNGIHFSEYHGVINNRPAADALPMSHKFIWEAQDTVYFCCPHVNPMHIHPDCLKDMPDRFFHSLDSEIDFIIKGNDFYMTKAEDKMYCLEISNQSKAPLDDRFVNVLDYGRVFWQVVAMRDTLKFFFNAQEVAINREMRPSAPLIPEKQIRNEREQLKHVILTVDPYKGKILASPRLHDAMYNNAA